MTTCGPCTARHPPLTGWVEPVGALRRDDAGRRVPPAEVADRIRVLWVVVVLVAGSLNHDGIRRWWQRPRAHTSADSPPATLFCGKWPSGAHERRLCSERPDRTGAEGTLLQLDGIRHRWLEDRGPELVLVGAIDDATGLVSAALFGDQEDAAGYLLLLRDIALAHGLPGAIYRHGHSASAPPTRARRGALAEGGPALSS